MPDENLKILSPLRSRSRSETEIKMGRIDVNKDRHLTVWRYTDERVYDLKSASSWIAKAAKIPSLETDYISLRDLTNRNDEGNNSSQISGKSSSIEIYNKAQKADIDSISLTGKYKGKLIVVGVNLRNRFISITLKNSSIDLIKEIQGALNLDDQN